MNSNDRIQLDKLIKEHNVENNTENIKQKKHSELIRNDVKKLLLLKSKYSRLILTNKEHFKKIASSQCKFLFTYYKDIYTKIVDDEMNVNTLFKLLDNLKLIEDGDKDQHESSYEVGKLLKNIYIDSEIMKEQKNKKKTNKK